jgi:hypothetical protein
VRLTIPVESSGGPVLAVPVSALTLAADGSSRVQRDVDGTTEFVPVRPGLTADGYVAVTATAGALQAGDLVVIGFEQRNTTSQPNDTAPISVTPSDTSPASDQPTATVNPTGTTGAPGG